MITHYGLMLVCVWKNYQNFLIVHFTEFGEYYRSLELAYFYLIHDSKQIIMDIIIQPSSMFGVGQDPNWPYEEKIINLWTILRMLKLHEYNSRK